MPIGSGEGQEDKDKIIIYGAAEKKKQNKKKQNKTKQKKKARALWSET